MKISDQISAVFWLLVAIYVCFKSFGYGLMEETGFVPGPGFVTLLTGVILGFLSILLLIESAIDENNKNEEDISLRFGNFKDVILLSTVLLAYAVFSNTLGFILSMFILMAFLFRGHGKRGKVKKWLMPICIGLSISLASNFFFSYLLGAQLPKGFFGIW